MSVDSMFGAVDAAIDGTAADASKAKKEKDSAAKGKKDGPNFLTELASTILGNNNKDVPVAPAAPAATQSAAKTTGFADGVDGKIAPQAEPVEQPASSATDAATNPQDAAKKSGEDTMKILFKMFGF
jgi:hypothetical protein